MKHQGGEPLASESPLVPREHPLASLKYYHPVFHLLANFKITNKKLCNFNQFTYSI